MDSAIVSEGLQGHYERLNGRWVVNECVEEYKSLVIPNGNSAEPFHRWFHFKEGYSHRLLSKIVDESDMVAQGKMSIYDPFCGSGTTILSALDWSARLGVGGSMLGIERNPVMHIISRAKIDGIKYGPRLARQIEKTIPEFWSRVSVILQRGGLNTESTTLNNELYFKREWVGELLAMSQAANEVSDSRISNFLKYCIASSVEPSGYLRRDGRALRYNPRRAVVRPAETFLKASEGALADMLSMSRLPTASSEIRLGDARKMGSKSVRGKFDWAVFSPPYPNNIDYTEVYKLEAWALGIYKNSVDVRSQRLRTLRSHPSIRFPDKYSFEKTSELRFLSGELLDPILQSVPNDQYRAGRVQVIRGYADDMLQTLRAAKYAVKDGGNCAVVVGNSAHGRSEEGAFVIASDLIIARLAEMAGWCVSEIRVARRPSRRKDPSGWLRESVVILSS